VPACGSALHSCTPLRRRGRLHPDDVLPRMSNQTPATVTTLKAFSDAAAALVADAKKVAATKDASAIASAKATAETTATQIETALEAN